MVELADGEKVVAAQSILTADGEVIPAGTAGYIIGWVGKEALVEWATESGNLTYPANPSLVRAGPKASHARSRSRVAYGVVAARLVVRKR